MDKITSKFYVYRKDPVDDSAFVQMIIVGNDTEENKSFHSVMPIASIHLAIAPPEVAQCFITGEEYYVDFRPVKPLPEFPIDEEFEAEKIRVKLQSLLDLRIGNIQKTLTRFRVGSASYIETKAVLDELLSLQNALRL